VIIIIGILSVAAIPKFGDIKDRAKISSEYSSLSGLEGAITGAMEFQYEDYTNYLVDWHEQGINTATDGTTSLATVYKGISDNGEVLKKIVKKGDALKIVAFADKGITPNNDSTAWDDILIIKAQASNAVTGTKESDDAANGGNGKPDKNDFWIFNASPDAIDVYHHDGKNKVTTTVESGEIKLIDNGEAITDTNAANESEATAGKIGINNGSAVTITNISLLNPSM
jgi:type II secretory pathway pseudopilin PulG